MKIWAKGILGRRGEWCRGFESGALAGLKEQKGGQCAVVQGGSREEAAETEGPGGTCAEAF